MKRRNVSTWGALLALVFVVGIVGVVFAQSGKDSNYVGAEKCKNCHEAEYKGNQYAKWKETKMSKAMDTLAGATAKDLGTKAGVADPATDPKCTKCHITASGVDKAKIEGDMKNVQCEACHGPGGLHVKNRLAEAAEAGGDDVFGDTDAAPEYKPVPEGEIVVKPDAKVCESCHNSESPTFKSFNYDELVKQFQHPDPRKKK